VFCLVLDDLEQTQVLSLQYPTWVETALAHHAKWQLAAMYVDRNQLCRAKKPQKIQHFSNNFQMNGGKTCPKDHDDFTAVGNR